MPVTKTAKRALRSSLRKREVNKKIISALEIALRVAKKGKEEAVLKAMSLADIAAKKKVLHKNKAARIKSKLSKLLPKDRKAGVKAKQVSASKTKSPKKKKK